ncbi:DUF4211 domain-containing protein [Caerostris extrusa]|uniref:DUF4211 domain-containing protein n=1 Tax=Caerostris extrusa TaxID=172846 RepID=A0AAV4XS59_CAEEX|nr:DUF4211 domain-containing protein [Caerostris extrusa]
MNDIALSSSLPRQEHIPGYGNAGGPHHFLLAASHGLNPSQANHNDPSFQCKSGAAGLFKAVNRENDFNDLRTGFSHCGMPPYGRNSEGNNGLPGTPGLGSGHLFPNSMPPGSWRHSGIIPSQCGPFCSFVEQDLSRGYRTILSSPARPPSSYVDSTNTSHSSILSPQNDPYFSSVSDNYYSSCSKNDFAAYSSYCSNVQPGVQRSSISPYCYPQSFGNFEANVEKQDVPTTSTNSSANSNFSNFVPNNSLNGNPTHLHNGQISRQSVITSNINNNSAMYNSESHPPNHSYNTRESYPYPPGAAHATSCLPTHPTNSRGEVNSGRQSVAHMNNNNNNHHSSSGQNLYPPMSTPIPASTPAHTTPPSSSMGQAYIPTPLPMSHDSGCSSVNSQSVMYHSPSNDGCYSTPGTCHSESGSPAKQDLSQHSSPSVYSVESSNLSINSGNFVENAHVRPHSSSEMNYNIMNGGVGSDVHESTSDSSKVVDENLREVGPTLMTIDSRFDNRPASVSVQGPPHVKHVDPTISSRSECAMNTKNEVFSFPSESSPPALDFTAKGQKCKRSRKRKCDSNANPLPLNCTYSHLENNQSQLTSPTSTADTDNIKTPLSNTSLHNQCSTPVCNDVPVINSSPHPVDLSHSVDLSIKKQDSPPEKDLKDTLPDLNYETDKSTGGKWSLVKKEVLENDDEVIVVENAENLTVENNIEKEIPKSESPMCRTPPMDDLSDESKSCAIVLKKILVSWLAYHLILMLKIVYQKEAFQKKKQKRQRIFTIFSDIFRKQITSKEKKRGISSEEQKESDNKNLIVEPEDKDNFDEAPSLDPTLFGCSTLQKEMVVPNPEAPSFSSDEDENSTQGIFDSVAMAIQRLCEDNEEDHNDKGNKSSSSSKSNSSKKEMAPLTDLPEASGGVEEMQEDEEITKEDTVEECTIKRACVVKGRRGKRRRTRHLLVIKVKRTAEKTPVLPKNVKTTSTPRKTKRTRSADKEVEIIGKPRNCVKRKYAFGESEENANISNEVKEIKTMKGEAMKMEEIVEFPQPLPDVITSTLNNIISTKPQPTTTQPHSVELSSEPGAIIHTVPVQPTLRLPEPAATRKRRRKPRKLPVVPVAVPPTVITTEPDLPKKPEETAVSIQSSENSETSSKLPTGNNESCWNTETHFKTGDYVISIDSQNSKAPPMWRIEGKNVLQLFEYSRWSPSSKHKYLKQPVKIIKSDDDTVIVELLKNSENVAEQNFSGSCDYTVHPQRENFEVYLQTLVCQKSEIQFIAHFQSRVYDPMTLENKEETHSAK